MYFRIKPRDKICLNKQESLAFRGFSNPTPDMLNYIYFGDACFISITNSALSYPYLNSDESEVVSVVN